MFGFCFQTPVSQDEASSAFDNIGLSQSTKSLDKESLKPLVIPTDQGQYSISCEKDMQLLLFSYTCTCTEMIL